MLPGVQIIQAATWEYLEERQQRVRLRSEDRVGLKSKMVGQGCGDRVRHVSPATRGLASARARACSGRLSLCTESKARQQVKCREMQRTYGCPALEKTCSKKVLFSEGVISHSFGQFSTSARETHSTCSTWFVLEKSRIAL